MWWIIAGVAIIAVAPTLARRFDAIFGQGRQQNRRDPADPARPPSIFGRRPH